MSWLADLAATYDRCVGREGAEALWPLAHTEQQAHVEIRIDGSGRLRGARAIDAKDRTTMIPCTVASAGRTSKVLPHPLCDDLQYVAADLGRWTDASDSADEGTIGERHGEYIRALRAWASSEHSHPKVRAILTYVDGGNVVRDLVQQGALPVEAGGRLSDPIKLGSGSPTPAHKILVRWVVEDPTEPAGGTWQDDSLKASWARHRQTLDSRKGLCVVSGEIRPLAETHPQKVRNNGDKAKLISSNDGKRTEQDKEKQAGFTFRGRFTTADQAAPIASEVSEKAHHALRWLIRKQGYLRDGLAVVSWTTEGAATPRVAASTFELDAESGSAFAGNDLADTDQAFAERLRRSIAGYSAKLNPTQDVLLLALDSAAANQGRLAITYERTLLGSEFLARIARWHGSAAWHQRYEKGLRFVGAPAPDDVAEAAYGEKVKDTHRKQIITRLLPCIVDGAPVPSDLVAALRRRAASPTSFKSDKRWQWIKCLGIACAMFKAQHPERRYQLTLEEARSSRDYLFGRLLAVADSLERIALGLTKEGRDTNATRLMQRFADRPSSTWRTIELSLQPYRMKLRASRGGALTRRDKELKVIFDLFQDGDFESDAPLSAEFLLGYHRQLSKLARKPGDTQNPNQDEGAGDADADEED